METENKKMRIIIDKKYIIEKDVMVNNTVLQAFQMFVEHFKFSGFYMVEGGTRAILFHTVKSIELVKENV